MDNNFKDTLKKALIVNGENGTYNKEHTKYIIDLTFYKKTQTCFFSTFF